MLKSLSEINPIPLILVALCIPLIIFSIWIFEVQSAHLKNLENRMMKEASTENCAELSDRLHLWDGEMLKPDNVLNYVQNRMVELKC